LKHAFKLQIKVNIKQNLKFIGFSICELPHLLKLYFKFYLIVISFVIQQSNSPTVCLRKLVLLEKALDIHLPQSHFTSKS